jgi:hypothetical protein
MICLNIQAFAIEEARLRKQIQGQPEQCEKREKEIVEEISEWKLKAAQRNFRKKPLFMAEFG